LQTCQQTTRGTFCLSGYGGWHLRKTISPGEQAILA